MNRLYLGTWLGVPVYVQPAFFVFFGIVFGLGVLTMPLNRVALDMAKILSMFLFIMPHEFGHVLVGRHLGLRTQEIIVSFFGAGALMPELKDAKPKAEILVALAGPAVTLALAGLALAAVPLSPGWLLPAFVWMAKANLVLFVFNMLPIFPMDGGRVLRGLANLVLRRIVATRLAIVVSLCIVAAFWGGVFAAGVPFIVALIVTVISVPTGICEWQRVGSVGKVW